MNTSSPLNSIIELLKDNEKREAILHDLKTQEYVLEEVKGLQLFLKNNGWDIEKLDEFLAAGENVKQLLTTHKKQKLFKLSSALKYAAILIPPLFLGGYFWKLYTLDKPTATETLYAKYKLYEPGLPVVMGETSKPTFQEAMLHFKNSDYIQAEQGFLAHAKEHLKSDTINYFLGHCAQEQNQLSQAKNYFKSIPEQSIYYWQSQYNLALVYLLENNKELARNQFTFYVENAPQKKEILRAKRLLQESYFDNKK